MYYIAILFFAILVLIKSSDITIKNSIKLSKLSGINKMSVGFIFIAVATSIPELSIAVMSSIRGEGTLSLGNAIGANISNLLLIFGAISLFGFTITKKEKSEALLLVAGNVLLAVVVIALGVVDIGYGVFALIVFWIFCKWIAKKGININSKPSGIIALEIVKSVAMLLISVAVVVVSANFVTDSAIAIARELRVHESIIGATILSIGTTLPEFSVAVMALRRKNVDLAIGDSLGSVITNLTLVLGAGALINPITISAASAVPIAFLIAGSVLFIAFVYRRNFYHMEALALLGLYVIYIVTMTGMAITGV